MSRYERGEIMAKQAGDVPEPPKMPCTIMGVRKLHASNPDAYDWAEWWDALTTAEDITHAEVANHLASALEALRSAKDMLWPYSMLHEPLSRIRACIEAAAVQIGHQEVVYGKRVRWPWKREA
jgi:hypothetical protein